MAQGRYAGCGGRRAVSDLHDLYRQYDEAWKAYVAIPQGERREVGEFSVEATALDTEMRTLVEQIRVHPDKRDFEDDLKDVLGSEIRAAPKAIGAYSTTERGNKAVAVYSALGNVEWEHELGTRFHCSFRYAGSMVARIYGDGDYMDWYCSGIEGHVDEDIAEALAAKGWKYKELS